MSQGPVLFLYCDLYKQDHSEKTQSELSLQVWLLDERISLVTPPLPKKSPFGYFLRENPLPHASRASPPMGALSLSRFSAYGIVSYRNYFIQS